MTLVNNSSNVLLVLFVELSFEDAFLLLYI